MDEQVAAVRASGVSPRVGSMWSGRLEQWLAAVLPPGAYERYDFDSEDAEDGGDQPRADETLLEWTDRRRAGVQTWSFPTDALRAEYLATVSDRPQAEVLALLRLFLFNDSCFGGDTEHLHQAFYVRKDPFSLDYLPTEFRVRLNHWVSGNAQPHPGIRWVLDLLPHAPQQAIDAITGYLNVYRGLRPEGRSEGLLDAIAVIRARWIDDLTNGTEALFRLSPRDLEVLVAALYQSLEYAVELTPPSRDGGRDVVVVRETPGRREVVQIECKTHTSPVGVGYVRQLRGVLDRFGASRGILVTIGRFTRGARQESADGRIELVDGATLIRMLNAAFGPLWVEDRAWITRSLPG